MKKTAYSKPQCEITVLTLLGSLLEDFPIGGPSGGGLPTNEGKFEEDDDEFDLAGRKNLWDD